MTCDFQQCGILTSADSDDPVRPPIKLRTSKKCSVSSLALIEYLRDQQRLCSDCAYAQADLRLCWSHIPQCWKSHVTAQIVFKEKKEIALFRSSNSPSEVPIMKKGTQLMSPTAHVSSLPSIRLVADQ